MPIPLIQRLVDRLRPKSSTERLAHEMRAAIVAGSIERLSRVLTQGAPADTPLQDRGYSCTPLSLAVVVGRADIARVLLAHGASPVQMIMDSGVLISNMSVTSYAILLSFSRTKGGCRLDVSVPPKKWPSMSKLSGHDQDMIALLLGAHLNTHGCGVSDVLAAVHFPPAGGRAAVFPPQAIADITAWYEERLCRHEKNAMLQALGSVSNAPIRTLRM